jgi:hypothetical protein
MLLINFLVRTLQCTETKNVFRSIPGSEAPFWVLRNAFSSIFYNIYRLESRVIIKISTQETLTAFHRIKHLFFLFEKKNPKWPSQKNSYELFVPQFYNTFNILNNRLKIGVQTKQRNEIQFSFLVREKLLIFCEVSLQL